MLSIILPIFKGVFFMKQMACAFFTAITLAATPFLVAECEPIANYQVLFSPDEAVAEELISLIDKETKSIKAAVYTLMHRGIAKALVNAHKRGVHVEVIVDPHSVRARSPVKKMGSSSLPVFVWNPDISKEQGEKQARVPLMHDKFCVFGNNRVWTGSFNFTFQASNYNRENVLILENAQVAQRYLEEFEKVKQAGCISLKEYLERKEILKKS